MKNYAILLFSIILVGCASPPVATRPPPPFSDHLFSAPSERIRADDVFALSPAMKQYVNVEIANQLRIKGPQQGLFDALYNKRQLKLAYDSAMTRNAVQTFEARSGNCLSLVIMTAALAKEIGLPVQYNDVFIDETWRRNGDIYFSNRHVNLTLGQRLIDVRPRAVANTMTIDFIAPDEVVGYRSRIIEEKTIIAMYMNNRAAESLAVEQLNDAYWWARAAIVQDPGFLGAQNTLAVIYQHHGDLRLAEQALRYVIEREPENASAISNLAQVLNAMGRGPEAEVLTLRLKQIQPYAPYFFFNQGMIAMRNGDFGVAKSLFARELKRDPYNAEFEYWLGTAYFRLNDLKQADKHLNIALENSTTRKDHDLYAAKLERIRASRIE